MYGRTLALMHAALAAVSKEAENVTEEDRKAVAAFIIATPDEDQWLNRNNRFLDGSHALLARCMLSLDKNATAKEKKAEDDYPRVREALKFFAVGDPLPPDLVFATKICVTYWSRATSWEESIHAALVHLRA